jgi:phospholipase/carboxylesterase
MGLARLVEDLPAPISDHREVATRVVVAPLTLEQSVTLEPVYQPGEPTPAEQNRVRQLRHPHPPPRGVGEKEQHLVGGEREAVPLRKLGIERSGDRGVHPQHPPPRGELVPVELVHGYAHDSRYSSCSYNQPTRTENVSLDIPHRLRRAAADPEGALVLFHGRGADEHDLFPLLDMLDPERRLLGATLRGPLSLPPGGAHWYIVRRVGFPDPDTFHATYRSVMGSLDDLLAEHAIPPERTVLGGFSQGAVMSYALALGEGRPRPAGILALSGFIPTVDGFALDLQGTAGLPVAIGHGEYDPVIPVEFGRDARHRLTTAGAEVTYRESPIPHAIDPGFVRELPVWLARAVAPTPA